jgi:hypothetical protein
MVGMVLNAFAAMKDFVLVILGVGLCFAVVEAKEQNR